jgi:hypothetical protein
MYVELTQLIREASSNRAVYCLSTSSMNAAAESGVAAGGASGAVGEHAASRAAIAMATDERDRH